MNIITFIITINSATSSSPEHRSEQKNIGQWRGPPIQDRDRRFETGTVGSLSLSSASLRFRHQAAAVNSSERGVLFSPGNRL
ncbi:hypothetical protein Hanom_Chr11g01019291 [Helianthus anomalus]